MIKMSLIEAAQILSSSQPVQDISFEGIGTDTRKLTPGNLFIAIRGEQYNGHDFLAEALKKGAAAALVDHPVPNIAIPQLIVEDTLKAFGQLSQAWREQFTIPVIGVTGSNGKTTLKNMIASILTSFCGNDKNQVLATEGNLNNNIGVPIMLCRMNATHRYAVIEMGMNHFGEIDYLTHLAKPEVAVINNAAEAHLEGLKNVAGVAKAKGEIFLGLATNGTAVLNRDDAHYDYWQGLVLHHKQLTFGFHTTAAVTATIHASHVTVKTPQGEIDVTLPLLGKHNVQNALAATAVCLALNIDLQAIKRGLEQVAPAPGRMRQYHLETGTRIIDDTYNANPFSLQAAVNTLATLPGKKILVVGDMKELGPNAKQLHFEAGEKIRAAGIHHLFTLGDMSAAASKAFGTPEQHFTDREKLITALKPYLQTDTTILIKGSRSMQMEKVVAGLIPENQLEHLH